MTDKAATERDFAADDTAEAGDGDPVDSPAAPSEESDLAAGEEEVEAEGSGGEPDSPEALAEAAAEDELTRSLEQLQVEFDELNDRHLRLAAEFTNYRRRQETEMMEAWGRAQADLVRRLLDVLDDLQRVSALDPGDESVSAESIVEGVDLVERKFLRTLEDAGVEIIAPEGEPFDPAVMEAMMRVPAESDDDDDLVAEVFQKGYRLKGHLVRPARVSVFKAE
ncbi:MAG TPA: nucleotide exchange factor GrpE [Longimicrobiales bacterium]|nr:nucleotide exchange factor GrpE [Longimicrobiales bacterium]